MIMTRYGDILREQLQSRKNIMNNAGLASFSHSNIHTLQTNPIQ